MYNNQLHELKFPLTSIWRDAVYPLVLLLFLVNIYIYFSVLLLCLFLYYAFMSFDDGKAQYVWDCSRALESTVTFHSHKPL